MTRLSEKQIQQYLDGTLGFEEKRQVEQTLLVSPADRERLEQYRMLFGELGNREVHSLAERFIPEVIAESDNRQQLTLSVGAWIAGAGIASIVLTFILSYFVEFQPLWHSVVAYTNPLLSESQQLWSSVVGLVDSLGTSAILIAAAGVILLAVQSLDRILVAHKYERQLR